VLLASALRLGERTDPKLGRARFLLTRPHFDWEQTHDLIGSRLAALFGLLLSGLVGHLPQAPKAAAQVLSKQALLDGKERRRSRRRLSSSTAWRADQLSFHRHRPLRIASARR